MNPSITLIRKADQTIAQWSGGTTTQLYIYPEASEYSKRNFDFRISTATVEEGSSSFTSLPGISRTLMILDGTFVINHEGEYTRALSPFDTESFKGEWKTTGKGKVTDFNLMTRGNVHGTLSQVTLPKGETYTETKAEKVNYLGYYLYEGAASIQHEKTIYTLQAKDFILIQTDHSFFSITIQALENCILILSSVSL